MITVMVTSHKVTEKNIKGFKRIILYSMYNIYKVDNLVQSSLLSSLMLILI